MTGRRSYLSLIFSHYQRPINSSAMSQTGWVMRSEDIHENARPVDESDMDPDKPAPCQNNTALDARHLDIGQPVGIARSFLSLHWRSRTKRLRPLMFGQQTKIWLRI